MNENKISSGARRYAPPNQGGSSPSHRAHTHREAVWNAAPRPNGIAYPRRGVSGPDRTRARRQPPGHPEDARELSDHPMAGHSTARSVPQRSPSAVVVRSRLEHEEVPQISYFYGIVITIYYRDHDPPHFHAVYGEYQAQIVIATLEAARRESCRLVRRDRREWGTPRQRTRGQLGERPRPGSAGYDRTSPMIRHTTSARVTSVTATDGFVLRVGFDDGTEREVNLEGELWGPMFTPLREDPDLLQPGARRRSARNHCVAQRR